LLDPACVKVVVDREGRALYFSRSAIPHPREWHDDLLAANPPHFLQHLGVYGYRRELLSRLASLSQSGPEQLEKLEQLRVLHAGYRILVGIIDQPTIGIDTPADYRAFVSRQRNR
jgi:3-deoxy-manno-octulosonate cytidylyltransferase (CMP-KDO synthetase)